MSRLIDADALIEDLQIKRSLEDNLCCRCCLDVIIEIVDAQPTAYDVDKVVEELEETKDWLMKDFVLAKKSEMVKKDALSRINQLDGAIEIVKEVGGLNESTL